MFEILANCFSSLFAYLGFIQSQRFKDPLSKADEAKYLALLKENDSHAREVLIEHNLRLVAHIVKKYDIKKIDKEDLISIGTIGLIKAIDTFKPETGHKLTTYAARCIENEILMALRSNAKHLNNLSLNEPIAKDDEGNMTLIDTIACDEKNDVIADFMLQENIETLMQVLHVLDEREFEIIKRRFGLFNQKEQTQKEIAQEFHISRSYVSRIEKRATIKLYKAFASKTHYKG